MIWRVLVFYVLTWFLTILAGGLQQEAGLLPSLTFLPQWGPGLAGLLTARIFRKADGWRINWFKAEMPGRRYLALLGLPLLLGGLAYLIALFVFEIPAGPAITPTLLNGMPFGALGEEIGWRAYLHRRTAPHLPGYSSAALVGLLWTLFHVQFYAGGALFVAVLAIGFVAMSVMMQALLVDYEFNVLGAAIYHLGINLGSLSSFGLFLDFNLGFALIYSGIAAVLAVATVYVLRRRTS